LLPPIWNDVLRICCFLVTTRRQTAFFAALSMKILLVTLSNPVLLSGFATQKNEKISTISTVPEFRIAWSRNFVPEMTLVGAHHHRQRNAN
jgi:hypothetical protein